MGQAPENFKSGRGFSKKDPLEEKYSRGAMVFHDDYGEGQIVGTDHTSDGEYVVTVSFMSGGIKKFLPKYQKSSLLVLK